MRKMLEVVIDFMNDLSWGMLTVHDIHVLYFVQNTSTER